MTIAEWLIDRATVYTESPATGAFTVEETTDLHCRLCKIDATGAGSARTELLAKRRLVWDASYEMPPNAQLDISGHRWNVVSGTPASERDKPGTIKLRAADVVRADLG